MADSAETEEAKTGFKFLKDTLFSTVAPVVGKIKGLVLIPVIAKILGATDYGLWHQFTITVGLLTTVATLRLGAAINRFLSPIEDLEELGQEFSSIVVFVTALSVVVSGIGALFPGRVAIWLFGDASWWMVVWLLAVYVPLSSVSNRYLNMLRSRRRHDANAAYTLVKEFVLGVGLVGLVVWTESIVLLLSYLVAVQVAALAFLVFFIHHRMQIPVRWPRFERLSKYIRFSFPLLIAGAGHWTAQMADRYVLVQHTDLGAVGAYSVPYALAGVGLFAVKPLLQVILPDFSVLYERGLQDKIERRFNTILKYFVASQCLVIAGAVALNRDLILLFSSEEFLAGVPVLSIVPLGFLFYGVLQFTTQLVTVGKQTVRLGFLWAGIAGLNVVLNLWLIPIWGLIGAAAATVAAYCVGAVICVRLARRKFSITLAPGTVVRVLLFGGIACFLMIALPRVGWGGRIVDVAMRMAVGILIYCSGLMLTGFVSQRERRLFSKFIPERLQWLLRFT
ncbi:MAG: lipopolysaccharide biosynthesis protein [Bradymonadaceae bacterium]